jgi:hypothetical protein
MHPILVAALAQDRHRRCPYGAVTWQPYTLCRGCRHRQYLEMQDHATALLVVECTPIPKRPARGAVLPLLQSISKVRQG